MSLLSWFRPAQNPVKPAVKEAPDDSVLVEPAKPAHRKSERNARREMLFAAVRDAMTRAGVLSASYKFKVLSLDARGRQFLVMVDIAQDDGTESQRFAGIEKLIIGGAKARYDIAVSAVYWRTSEQLTAGDRHRAGISRPGTLDTKPAAQPAAAAEPAPTAAVGAARPGGARFDPIQADEVAAFKSALAAGVEKPAAAAAAAGLAQAAGAHAFDGSSKQGPQSYTLLTGFEDTELPDPATLRPALSSSQYGDLN
jgi:hypothetical protein